MGDGDTGGEVGGTRRTGAVAGNEDPVVPGGRRGLPEHGEVGGDRGGAGSERRRVDRDEQVALGGRIGRVDEKDRVPGIVLEIEATQEGQPRATR